MASSLRTRFAPSPTGYLHLGSARSALFTWLLARHSGGKMLLRIEDTDAERSKPELIDVIFRTLEWLGIDWDEDPQFQSKRSELYRDAASTLVASDWAYHCDCTREAIVARSEERGGRPGYDGFCRERELTAGTDRVVRFRVPDEGVTAFTDMIRDEVSFANADLEDFVIVRANGQAMFLVANAVDDMEMGITHVVRGEDLLPVTPKVLLLRHALGRADDPLFAHLPLIVNEKRQKLSKRRDDVAIEDYSKKGYLPDAMSNYLATLGWGAPDGVEIRPMSEIVDLFDMANVSKAGAFFDVKKLDHFNGEYIRALSLQSFVLMSKPYVVGDSAPWASADFDPSAFEVMAPLVQERVTTLSEVPGYVDFLFMGEDRLEFDDDSWQKVMVKDHDAAVIILDGMVDAFATCEWSVEVLGPTLFGFGEERGIKKGRTQAPIRLAITGRSVGPPLLESLMVLGRERCMARLRRARALL